MVGFKNKALAINGTGLLLLDPRKVKLKKNSEILQTYFLSKNAFVNKHHRSAKGLQVSYPFSSNILKLTIQ